MNSKVIPADVSCLIYHLKNEEIFVITAELIPL